MRRLPGCTSPALLLPLLCFAPACSGGGSGPAPDTLTIALIPKGTTHEFWKAVHAGAVRAAREASTSGRRVEVVFRGPEREDDREQQVALVQNFLGGRADAIVLAPLDRRALLPPVRQAMASGTPVVVIDSGLDGTPGEDVVAFVATDNREGGRLAGRALAELLGGRGRVLLLRYQEGSASTMEREAGFVEAIATFPDLELVDPHRYAGATRATAQEAAENLLAAQGAPDGVFCPNESSTFGMLLALRSRQLAGKVRFVGFDASPGLVAALRAGELDALVVQDPMRMGRLGVETALRHLDGEAVPPVQDTGVHLVTRTNMDAADLRDLLEPDLERWLGGR